MKKKKKTAFHPAPARLPVTEDQNFSNFRMKSYLPVALIVLFSFFVYLPVLHHGFLHWDDEPYIVNNPLVQSFHLKEIFSQYVMGNYHPLTVLILAVEHHFFGLNAAGFHAVNVLLHLLNVVLVFLVVSRLGAKTTTALVASLLFGIHPVHVESVAWISEVKDLLYTFFFLAAYLFYLKYLNNHNKRLYFGALLLFLAALLSKAMAVSLAVVLILTDFFRGSVNRKTLIEKIPFFALALVFGIMAILAQKSSGATDVIHFSFLQRIVFACYGIVMYLYKLVFPLHLSAFYPYPVTGTENIPVLYYSYMILLAVLVAAVIYSNRYSRKLLFGTVFFSVTIFPVLQLFPVGGAIMADRYLYLASIGIFYLAGEGFSSLWARNHKAIAITLLTGFTLSFSVKTFSRSAVWKDDMTLWSDVISQNPEVPVAYNNRGNLFLFQKEYDRAMQDYNKAIELNPEYSTAFFNRGNIFRIQKKYDRATADYTRAIELDTVYFEAIMNRGIVFMSLGNYERALEDFNKSVKLNPRFPKTYNNRGNVYYYQKRYDEAISDFTKAISLKKDYAEAYYNRGLAEFHSGNINTACKDLKISANLGYQPAAGKIFQICNE